MASNLATWSENASWRAETPSTGRPLVAQPQCAAPPPRTLWSQATGPTALRARPTVEAWNLPANTLVVLPSPRGRTGRSKTSSEAPRPGFEPGTYRLTAGRSTVELSRNGRALDCRGQSGTDLQVYEATRQRQRPPDPVAALVPTVVDVPRRGPGGARHRRRRHDQPDRRRAARRGASCPARARRCAGLRGQLDGGGGGVGSTRRGRAGDGRPRRPDLHRQPRARALVSGRRRDARARGATRGCRGWRPSSTTWRAQLPPARRSSSRTRAPPAACTTAWRHDPERRAAGAARAAGAPRDHQRLARRGGPDGDQPAAAAHGHQGLRRHLAGARASAWTGWSISATT